MEQPDQPTPKPGKDLRETAVARVMTSTSIGKHPTAFFSTGLPILQVALNVEMMSANLAPLLEPLNGPAMSAPIAYAKLLAYKQGNRGLIQYEVRAASGESRVASEEHGTDTPKSKIGVPSGPPKSEGPLLIFGKLYPDLGQASRVHDTMQALWANVFSSTMGLGYGIPRPLGLVPELSMLVYIPAVGQMLNEVIQERQAPRYMSLAAAWLAALHTSNLSLDRSFQIEKELTNLQAWSMLIGHKYPDQSEIVTRLSAKLRETGNTLQFADNVPMHKDFHYGHIVVNDRLTIIDFDEMRYGDPNFDVAHFCANLFLLAHRTEVPDARLATLQNSFLDSYAQHAAWRTGRRFKFFYGYTCLKIAKQLCTRRGLRPRPDGEEEHRQVKLVLAQAARVVEGGL